MGLACLQREPLGRNVYDCDGRRLITSSVLLLDLKTFLLCSLAIKAVKTHFGWIAHQLIRYLTLNMRNEA